MSICTTTDVYSAASLIGQELQLLIDEHGPGDFESLMYKVITVLEELEFCVSHFSDADKLIEDLQEQRDALKEERNDQELRDFALDLDSMQQSWYNETQKLMDTIASLEAENQRLKRQLEAVEAESEASPDVPPSVSALVLGEVQPSRVPRPPSLAIKATEVDSLLAHTDERLQLNQEESRAADLQLIRLLKASIVNQNMNIRKIRREILFVEASIDAAGEEVCRLARESGQMLASCKSPDQQVNKLNSEQAAVGAQLALCERKLEELSLLIGNSQQIDSPSAPSMPLHMAPGEGLESIVGGPTNEQDSLLALEQLRNLLYERNHLRSRLIELSAGLEAINDAPDEEVLYGPLPKEPFEKLHPEYAGPKTAIKALFNELLQRIADKTA